MPARAHSYTGAVVHHQHFGGAQLSRIMHPPRQSIAAHEHDWPVLSIFRLGAYSEQLEDGEQVMLDGPSVVFHPAGVAHADQIGAGGLETLSLSFDPAWLAAEARAVLPDRTCWRAGGPLTVLAHGLAQALLGAALAEHELRRRISAFLWTLATTAAAGTAPKAPPWAQRAMALLDAGQGAPTTVVARALDLHPAWLARTWRQWRGEGIVESQRRRRVERAVLALRASSAGLAQIAADCGFCDQSHMNRCFRSVLGRTPLVVRSEAALLAALG